MEVGTPEQKARFLPTIASGEEVWAQAWSEPDAGSDMAAISSKAVRDGDDWVITGQKIWASRAVWADWCFGIFRTDPEAERHRGLTFILCPLDSPGITVRPIAQLDGDTGFAEIFFDEVRVPVENTLGDVNQGWKVAMATAGFERGVSLRSPARFTAAADRLIDLWRDRADPADTALRDAVTDAWMRAEGYRLHTYQTVTGMIEGRPIGAEASLNKIFWSEMDVRIHELALDLLGPEAERIDGPDAATGSTASCSRCPGRSMPAPTRSSATSSPTASSSCRRGCEMRFSFTDDQRLFADGLGDLLSAKCTPAHVRAVWEQGAGHDAALWSQLDGMGVLSLLVPEQLGGLGGSLVDAVLLFQQLGRHAVPGPVVEHMLAAPVLAAAGISPAIATVWLDGPYVPHAGVAGVVLTGDAALAGFDSHEVDAIDGGRRLFTVAGGTSTPIEVPAPFADQLALAAAAVLVGLADRMIEMAADYARQRHQFGKPIGSFQAVKHLLADALLQIDSLSSGRLQPPQPPDRLRLILGWRGNRSERHGLEPG